jgi:UDP-3-O-acyl-N-acetylglucosamine deacetylase
LESSWSWTLDAGTKRTEVEVECETLDLLFDSLGLNQIDWLKIDVEGHEIPVLEGAKGTLARTRKLILEVAEGNETDCRELMRQAGFEVVAIDQGEKEEGLRPTSNWLLRRTNA